MLTATRPRLRTRPVDPTAPDWVRGLYDAHAAEVFGLAYRMLGERSAAEDVTQEAFLSAWRSAAAFDASRGSARSWLLAITRHRACDALRRRRDAAPSDAPGAPELVSSARTDDEALREVAAVGVRRALAELPDDQRTVVELAYFAGLTHTEIAERTGAPLGTVKGRMRLALEKLADALG